jgi:hypothetical protein
VSLATEAALGAVLVALLPEPLVALTVPATALVPCVPPTAPPEVLT